MYVAVKGGETAIEAAHELLAEARRGDPGIAEIGVAQIDGQLALAVDRVMTEGSLYDRELAALAIKQARGDLVEAVFLLRAYRTTLPRLTASLPIDTGRGRIKRRISAVFKDVPGGQVLGPTFDYSHRLLDFALAETGAAAVETGTPGAEPLAPRETGPMPRVSSLLGEEGLLEPNVATAAEPEDLTREPLSFPAARALRLQNLARADEGFLLSLAYSTQRGYGRNHPFAGEIRIAEIDIEIVPPEFGFPVVIGSITVTECEMVNQFKGSESAPPQFTRGYGLAFGESERKAMAMALVDRALRAEELGEAVTAPAQDQEFVLYHSDNVEASGFTQHLKLPHYVDFQAELNLVRRLRGEWVQPEAKAAE
ncbi:MAG: carbon-phosphorus lyase complex subunit PhnI [Alphaproteobacteria bacterium]|nr:carbon-phosphorus lyase complex subunit PhnI [Alphaproteobacteria bacterium]